MGKVGWISGLFLIAVLSAPSLRAQDVVLPGSTPQGDILRGQGQFLKRMAWYELNAAGARELGVKMARELEQWNREVYEAYLRELAVSTARRRSVRNERLAVVKRRLAEREQRLRTEFLLCWGLRPSLRTESRFARVGPTTPTRAGRLADASVDPTDARKATVRCFGRSDRSA
jgi:hypothetical protein